MALVVVVEYAVLASRLHRADLRQYSATADSMGHPAGLRQYSAAGRGEAAPPVVVVRPMSQLRLELNGISMVTLRLSMKVRLPLARHER